MQLLTEIAIERANRGIFTKAEVSCWVGGSPQRQFSLIKRALARREIVHIRRGLYCLSPKYTKQNVDPLVLAQRIYGPSYISMETALSCHGWIPEAVYTITSVSRDRSRTFDTALGHFSFVRIPQRTFYAGVSRVENGPNGSLLLASPLKALADYIYTRKLDWNSARPIVESLRVDPELLAGLNAESFDQVATNYSSLRVRRFLNGLRKDLKR